MAAFGWTWEYIDEFMTVPRLNAILKFWEHAPPVHQMIAGYFGFRRPSAKRDQSEALSWLMQTFPQEKV